MNLSDNVAILNERVAKACADSGRKTEEVTIVPATKCVPLEVIKMLPRLGISAVGENRVQEFTQKYEGGSELDWHIIGALQTNKVKYVVGKAVMIQSVDRITLATEIDKLSEKRNTVTDVLIEVNACGEIGKSGVAPEKADELAAYVSEMKNMRLKGIMCVPPINAEIKVYEKMRILFDSLREKYKIMDTLSMGMSGDYELAVCCGSTMIRPGRALFGERQPILNA